MKVTPGSNVITSKEFVYLDSPIQFPFFHSWLHYANTPLLLSITNQAFKK